MARKNICFLASYISLPLKLAKPGNPGCDSFPNGVLPTKRDVLQRLLHERNWQTRAAAVIVANELYERWINCNVYCISVDGIVFRILTLVKDF